MIINFKGGPCINGRGQPTTSAFAARAACTKRVFVKARVCGGSSHEAYGAHFHQDEDLWGVAGLLHDLDYQEYPEEHCQHVEAMLREAGYGDAMVRAILSHGYGLCTEVEPRTDMEKSLYAVDELTGLITAVVLMRPSNPSWILR